MPSKLAAPALAISPADPAREPGVVLARAVLRAGDLLGLTQKQLAAVLGISPASVSRLERGRAIDPDSKEGELAALFLRLWRSLDTIVGGADLQARLWLHAANSHVGGIPAQQIQSVMGLVGVAEYLDAMRGKL